jgi:hypothetical protein
MYSTPYDLVQVRPKDTPKYVCTYVGVQILFSLVNSIIRTFYFLSTFYRPENSHMLQKRGRDQKNVDTPHSYAPN